MINTSAKPLVLHILLYTPQITKNLVYVSLFTKDNQVFFEFHPSYCIVRDAVSKEVLLRGSKSDGLYKLDFSLMCDQSRYPNVQYKSSFDNHRVRNDSSNCMTYFAGQIKLKVSYTILHQRFGHPTSSTRDLVVKTSNMNVLIVH